MLGKIKQNAFTVAETMIVLIILGTLFTLIIPSTINKHRENINRVKIKKAMAYYEVVFKKLVVDNHIMTDTGFDRKLQTNNCDKIKKQFKIIETDSANPCIFRSAEDIWWNVTDFKAPLVSVKKANIDANNEPGICKLFRFSGHIVNGVLRINDMGYITDADEKRALEKTYGYINKTRTCE